MVMNKLPTSPTRGRRPGKPETRAAVLAAARTRFLADGYDRASLRAIAADAGVDVALLSYFFGSKRGLFGAAMALPVNPIDVLQSEIDGDLATLPERLLTRLLAIWDEPATGEPLKALGQAAITDPELNRLIRESIGTEIVARMAKRIAGPQATQRAVAFTTQIAGIILTRYLIGFEPIASMDRADVIRTMAPTLRYPLTRAPT